MTRAVVLGLVLVGALVPYARLMADDPVLSRDDAALLRPMQSLTSLGEYPALLVGHQVMDLQPVRDLSYRLDVVLGAALGHTVFHATNALLFVLLLLAAFRLFERLAPGWPAVVAVAVLAFHPVFGTGVAWIAARKHLLSALFLTLATDRWLRLRETGRARDGVVALVCFSLSLASQPIGVGWPVFAAVLVWSTPQRRWVLPAIALAGLAAVLNARYYTGAYVAQGSTAKFVSGFHPGVSLLAAGRAFFNLLCPAVVVTTYDPGAVWNLVGLVAGAFTLLLLLRVGGWKRAGPWLLFALLPLGVVLGRMTNVFLFDTYLFVPAIGLAAAVLVTAASATPVTRRGLVGGALLLMALGLSQAVPLARSYESEAALWARAWALEPSPEALAHHAPYVLDAGRLEEGLELAARLAQWDPQRSDLGWVLGRAVARQALSLDERAALFERFDVDDAWFHYFHARVEVARGNVERADALMQRALEHPEKFKGERAAVEREAAALHAR